MPETKTTGNESKTKYYYKWDNEVKGYEITAQNSTEILYKEWNEESKVTIDSTDYKKITKKVYDGSTQGATVSEAYYDIFGNMVQSNENNRTIKYTYDLIGNPLSAYYTDRNAYEYYTTDAIGNILTLKDRAGNTTTYTYDWLGRTMAITDHKCGWTSYTDHNNLVRTEIQYPP